MPDVLIFAYSIALIGFGFFMIGYAFGIHSQKIRDEKYFKDNIPLTVGTLLIDSTDPDGPYLFASLNCSADEVKNRSRVVMNVQSRESDISRN